MRPISDKRVLIALKALIRSKRAACEHATFGSSNLVA